MTPVFRRQPPADFDRSIGEERLKVCGVEADESDAFTGRCNLHCRETIALLSNIGAQTIKALVGFRTTTAKREEFHDPVVGIYAEEQIAVALFPVADHEPRRFDRLHPAKSSRR